MRQVRIAATIQRTCHMQVTNVFTRTKRFDSMFLSSAYLLGS